MSTQSGWYPDPVGGHQWRYYDGAQWTEHVADDGVVSTAPLTPTPQPTSTAVDPTPAATTITWASSNERRRLRPPPRGVLIGGAVVLLLAVVAATALPRVLHRGPSHPDAWDPRVADIVAFVERERGLTFRHPVEIEFLDVAAFTKEVTSEDTELSDDDRAELEQTTAMLRALGLISGDVDLFKELNKVSGEGTLALYSYKQDRVRMRGAKLTPEMRSVVAHELTHTLQDQHFELDRDFDTDSEATTFRAMVEGDAGLVEEAYKAEMLGDVDQPVENAEEKAPDLDAPQILISLFSAPYILGDAFLRLVVESEGAAVRNRVLEHPPVSDEQLLDPWRYLDGDDPDDVPVPELANGEKEVKSSAHHDFGAVAWYLVLSQRIDAREALAAVDGWGGDSYRIFKRGEKSCVRATFRGDTQAETAEMVAALNKWREAGATAEIKPSGTTVTLDACDPGASAPKPTPPAGEDTELLLLPALRSYVQAGLTQGGVPKRIARCVGAAMLQQFSTAQLTDPTGASFRDPVAMEQIRAMTGTCARG